MTRTRVIPVLLIQDEGLVKSIKFKNHKYVGDPINAVKVFNEKEVDEIAIIDIEASLLGRGPNFDLIQQIASEAFIPLSYGGGVNSLDDIRTILFQGAEKVIVQSVLKTDPEVIREASGKFGSQSIVACIDYQKNWIGKNVAILQRGRVKFEDKLMDWVLKVEDMGVGEIILQSKDRDGTFSGYDLDTVQQISERIKIPMVVLGGANSLDNMKEAVNHGASAVAAGSFFVFQQPHRAVLISYPSQSDLKSTTLI